jgi:hypothetical protein
LLEVYKDNVLTFFYNYTHGQGKILHKQWFDYLKQKGKFYVEALC